VNRSGLRSLSFQMQKKYIIADDNLLLTWEQFQSA